MRRFFTGVPIRAALGATLVVAVALVATGFALLHLLENDLADKADAQAAAEADRTAQALMAGVGLEEVTHAAAPVQVQDGQGKVVAASKGSELIPVTSVGVQPVAEPKTAEVTKPAPVPAKQYRWAAKAPSVVAGKPVTVYVAASLETERSAVRTVRLGMIGGLPILLVLVGFLTWLVAHRSLRPVAEAVERQRRFVADASHELRNPIASLRTQLEIAVEHPQLLDLEGMVDDTVRLQSLAADLLLLARLDAEPETPADTPVDLVALVREAAGAGVEVAGPGVEVETPPELMVGGSGKQLGRAVENLVANARRHAAGEVWVVVRREGASALVEVIDDGPGVPAYERERIFERFVRLDDARSRDEGGAGLGLAIAREIARHHRGTLTVHDNPTGGALFRLTLPARVSGGGVGGRGAL
ncbi:HAMP domain-containing sensor histidine kinase [Kribbella koreensis]|uniref:histidine kinase n=2 Tax=Kribbella koreensis TaxID=57909 RepID=A0ABN1QD64_9ACTN